jgi:hypothetical protein
MYLAAGKSQLMTHRYLQRRGAKDIRDFDHYKANEAASLSKFCLIPEWTEAPNPIYQKDTYLGEIS